jgi:hypothetical protein
MLRAQSVSKSWSMATGKTVKKDSRFFSCLTTKRRSL